MIIKNSTFIKLLEEKMILSYFITEIYVSFLAICMFKFKRGLALALIKEMILPNRQNRYKLRKNPGFALLLEKLVH